MPCSFARRVQKFAMPAQMNATNSHTWRIAGNVRTHAGSVEISAEQDMEGESLRPIDGMKLAAKSSQRPKANGK